jgi:tRNA(Arg) A34 adenosine deaminase TadA
VHAVFGMADAAGGDIVAPAMAHTQTWPTAISGLRMDRRAVVAATGSGIVALILPRSAAALDEAQRGFIAEAARMRREAMANGDEPFGAVVVKDGAIIGYGPSRVVHDHNPNAHAERIALLDAQRRHGSNAAIGAVIYSTSRPCVAYEDALALANVERMYFGADGADAGRPRRSR